jgi:hypothetical protein
LTNDYAKHTIRGGNDIKISPEGVSNENISTTGLDKDYITQWSYGIGESFTLISPYVKGGGTVALGDSPFAEDVENMDLTSTERNAVMNLPVYWGEQPITTGPVYIGIIVCFLALLGLVFLKTPIKWALLAVTIITLMLSWGKNYMGFTDFFLDYIPGYNKFRAVTIILVVAEFCIPLLGVLFLNELYKEREQFKSKRKIFLVTSSALLIFLLILKMVGLGDGYSSPMDQRQMDSIENQIQNQILSMNPDDLLTQYGLDISNPNQVQEFIQIQAEPYKANFESIKKVRASIFSSSMNRSILFLILAAGLLALFFYTEIKSEFLVFGLILLVAFDLIPVAYNYLGNQEQGNGYKFWTEKVNTMYPIPTSEADMQILSAELKQNPNLENVIAKAEKEASLKTEELGVDGVGKRKVNDAYKFSALNFNTNYRVFDLNGGFNSANSSYYHKALGGYHGAKLRNIQNLYDFHLSKSNNKVYDMLNVKYFIQSTQEGLFARPNQSAMGNAWLVREVKTFETPDDEIRALGNQFELKNPGAGKLFINGELKNQAFVYGSENIQYLLQDSIKVTLSNGLSEGMEVYFVMDINGKTNLIPKQTLDADTSMSFLKLVEIKVSNEFKPRNEALMLNSESKKLSSTKFTGEGNIELTDYKPNKLTYKSSSESSQLAIFSEIYYPDGWKAFIDGKEVEILKANYLLRALEIPSGKHSIEFVFDLPKYHQSNTLARFGVLAILLLLLGGIYTERKK